jgi:PPK2 family polyphosphate:nucleotide phosphotransferase
MEFSKRFKVKPGARVNLGDIDSGFTDRHKGAEGAAKAIESDRLKLLELQGLLNAERGRSLLLCLQGMDTAGKDGTINHIFSAMNPKGCRVVDFRQPSAEELGHDFLWRVHKAVPAAGEVVVFNRSHYEDVLVVRVHHLVSKAVWSLRYDHINAFERELADHGTHILKFFLHISKSEQLRRFKDRLDDPAKQWKISEADYAEREYWDKYVHAYDEALSRCSTDYAPWFVIPSDHKWFRNLAIARIVVEHLEGMKMRYPKPTVDVDNIRREYHAAKKG